MTNKLNPEHPIEYNSTRTAVKLPEYGRLVQDMVDFAKTIENRAQRQQYACTIFSVMVGLNPKMRGVEDFERKVWDHIAYLSNYELDIDYPFPVTRKNERCSDVHIAYPGNRIRFRHYGFLVESAIEDLVGLPEGEEKEQLMRKIAGRMKRNLAEWRGEGAEDVKVERDLDLYTDGMVHPDFSSRPLPDVHLNAPRFEQKAKGKKKKNVNFGY